MAIAAPTIQSDLSGFITEEEAAPIFDRAARIGVVPRLAQRVPLGPSGAKIPIITGRPSAGWVGEGAQKPASSGSMDVKHITPQKLASIMVVSAEVARLNPAQFLDKMRSSFAESFAYAFDLAALHDAGPDGTGGAGPFSTFVGQTGKSVEIGAASQSDGGTYQDLVSVLSKVVTDTDASGRRYRLTGWALDDVMEPALRGAVDTTGAPIWVDLPTDDDADVLAGGRLMRRQAYFGEGVSTPDQTATVGFAGDWSQAAWGQVGGISYRISTEATVTINSTLTSLFEHNLIAILAEAEFGFVVADTDAFVKMTNSDNSPITSA